MSFFLRSNTDHPCEPDQPRGRSAVAACPPRASWADDVSDEIAEMFGALENHVDFSRDGWSGMQVIRRRGRAPARSRKPRIRVRPPTGRPRGRPVGSGKLTERAQALELLTRGVSMLAVAKRIGVCRTTVKRWKLEAVVSERKAA